MNIKYLKFAFTFLFIGFILGFTLNAQNRPRTSQKNGNKKNDGIGILAKPNKDKIAEKLKNCKAYPGLFTLYQDTTNGKAYLLLYTFQIGKEFIYYNYIENGVTEARAFRGQYRDAKIFKVERYFNRVEWVVQNTNYYFDNKSPLNRAKDANISPALLISKTILEEDTANGKLLLDASDLFLSEALHQIKPSMRPDMPPDEFRLGKLNPEKTKYANIRSFPKNTEITINYVYDLPEPLNYGSAAVTDARSVQIQMQHSFVEAPDNNFKPRFSDPRIGYFTQEITDQTSASATPYRDVINRWHLEKKDPRLPVSEPVEPIVYWIEKTTPYEYRETIKEAALKWNTAFEKIGFRNAIQIYEQSDTASWEPGDIRYNVIRWTSSPTPPFYGYGPSFADPRTGQILGADIMIEYNIVKQHLKLQSTFLDKGWASDWDEFKKYCASGLETCHINCNTGASCEAGAYAHLSALFGYYALEAQNEKETFSSKPVKNALLKQVLSFVVLHEMGHTLGLRHNFKSSYLHSPQEINNVAVTRSKGLCGSVMEYPLINFSSSLNSQGDFFPDKLGPYDDWAIEFGYSEALRDEEEEKKRLMAILERSTRPELAFATDEDAMSAPGLGIDPRVQTYDLTSDPILYGIQRIQICNALLKKLKDKFSKDGESYQELVNAYQLTMAAISQSSNVIAKFIGGVYFDRAYAAQPGANTPFMATPRETQKRAMAALTEWVYSPQAFVLPLELIPFLQPQRRGYRFFSNSEDPKVHDRILTIQANTLMFLFHPKVHQRIVDSEVYGNTYPLQEVMKDLTTAIFSADIKSTISTVRQNLQVFYVKGLIMILENGDALGYPSISQVNALRQIQNIEQTLKNNAIPANQAHTNYLLGLIERAIKN
jgi:hypothetical protein